MQKMLPQALVKAETAFPQFFVYTIIFVQLFVYTNILTRNTTTQRKCLTTKIDVCTAHKGGKTEKDALVKENSAKASKMCVYLLHSY